MNHEKLTVQLNTIRQLVHEIRDNPHIEGPGRGRQGVLDCLTEIEQTAEQVWRDFVGPRVVGLSLADALEQVQRVTQLMDELELPPDHRQVLTLGMACELAADKFRRWRELTRAAEPVDRSDAALREANREEDGDELARAAA